VPTPLFSTYRQGENRVSSSLLAVFERLGIDLVARLLGAALEQPELELVTYRAQAAAAGKKGVPDGEMRASFRFLFEVKTVAGALKGTAARGQLERHLKQLDGDGYATELVIALTPDAGPPSLISDIGDARLVWTSFEALAQAIDSLVADPAQPASEQQRLLLRELIALFNLDGLLASDDVAVVAAGHAYQMWREYGAYLCQANRTFRRVQHWGFYRNKRIEAELPKVLAHWPEVTFDADGAERWKSGTDTLEQHVGELIEAMLAGGVQKPGVMRSVYLLQLWDEPTITRREQPLPHPGKGAWTQHQRYANLQRLLQASTTNDL